MSGMQTQTAARLGNANVDGVKNTDASMVFDADVESRVCARNGKRNRDIVTGKQIGRAHV